MKFYRILFLVSAVLTSQANAAPIGGDLSGANGSIATVNRVAGGQTLTDTTITTNKNFQKITWTDFSSKAGENITFNQPNYKSIVFNRVTGNISSTLAGNLTSNGRVVIMNGAGITFAAGSRVNVSSLYATTAKSVIGDESYGNFKEATAKIQNDGLIQTIDGGRVNFTSTNIVNNGVIISNKGDIILNGYKDFNGYFKSQSDSIANNDVVLSTPQITPISATSSSTPISITNSGELVARSGVISISSDTRPSNIANLINLDGVVDSTRLDGTNLTSSGKSKVIVNAGGDLAVGGKIVVNARGAARGGEVYLNANGNLNIKDTAVINANGGNSGVNSSSSDNMGGYISIKKYANSAKPNDQLKIDGKLYAGNGGASSYTGSIDIEAVADGTTYPKTLIGSTAVISTKSTKEASDSNGGTINIYANELTSSGQFLTDGVGSGTAGNINFKQRYGRSNIDISASKIYARGGQVQGNGGTVFIQSDKTPSYNVNNIYLSPQSGNSNSTKGKLQLCVMGNCQFVTNTN